MKYWYVLAFLLSLGLFNSCTERFVAKDSLVLQPEFFATPLKIEDNKYGTFLAGRVAHMRHDFSKAADFYIKSVNLGANDAPVMDSIYLLLAVEGRVDEAAKYAASALEKNDKNNVVYFILMTENFKNGEYDAVLEQIKQIKDKNYQKTVLPLFKAWAYAGKNDQKQALKELEALNKEPFFKPLYFMHRAMISEYFGDNATAEACYDKIANDESLALSYRSLQIIGNFYIRNGQKDKILKLISKYYIQNMNSQILSALYKYFQDQNDQNISAMVDTPQKGMGEALFNVGTFFRPYLTDGTHIFMALALYLNDKNDVAHVSVADVLEQGAQFDKANEEYAKILKDSPVYFMAQLKTVSNEMAQDHYAAARKKIETLIKEYPDNEQLMFNMGEVLRMSGDHKDAIKYYNKALDLTAEKDVDAWTVYYALGISYERNNEWEKAETAFKKALTSSNGHPYVLNYLGYTWLLRGENANEALFMIFDAYRKNPSDGHIVDSLGWALYRMEKFEDAVKVLERASEYLPANAVVSDHLGDAYWQVGRLAEAKFQWRHALNLKEDAEELKRDVVLGKIENGVEKPARIIYDETLLLDRLNAVYAQEQK